MSDSEHTNKQHATWAQHPIRTLHACVETLATAFKGFLPWPDEKRGSVVRGHEALIEDTIKRADACMVILDHAEKLRTGDGDAKTEHWRQWGIDGMPGDKKRLAEATWEAALRTPSATKQVVGRVWNDEGRGVATLNSVGRALPDDTPLYAGPCTPPEEREPVAWPFKLPLGVRYERADRWIEDAAGVPLTLEDVLRAINRETPPSPQRAKNG